MPECHPSLPLHPLHTRGHHRTWDGGVLGIVRCEILIHKIFRLETGLIRMSGLVPLPVPLVLDNRGIHTLLLVIGSLYHNTLLEEDVERFDDLKFHRLDSIQASMHGPYTQALPTYQIPQGLLHESVESARPSALPLRVG